MTEITCAAVLFDLDGVLVDSTPAVARVWTRWARAHGFNAEEIVARAHGRPSLATIRELLPNSDAEAENRVVERGEIEDKEGVVPLPGTMDLLASLPGDRWTIVTSCTRRLAEVRIRAAGLPLPAKMITSTDITHGKPDPEPYRKGAALLGFAPSECVVFEDAAAGVRSGKGAGARVIGFRTTMAEALLQDAGAEWVVDNAAQVRLLSATGELRLGLFSA